MKVINEDYYFGTDKRHRLLFFNKHLAFPTKEKNPSINWIFHGSIQIKKTRSICEQAIHTMASDKTEAKE